MNPRITNKERGLIKGALRRVFARSDLRREALERSIVKGYTNRLRKAVKTWCKCEVCSRLDAKSNIQIDHISPIIPVNSSAAEMSFDDIIDRIWCSLDNLCAICKHCHAKKTKIENSERRENKKLAKLK